MRTDPLSVSIARHKPGLRCEPAFLFALFAAATIIRYVLFDGPRRIAIVDEILYYDIARSIWQGNGLSFRGFETAFRKILYPFVLSPFFTIGNGVVRLKAIHLFNCALMASSVFPAWLVARRIGLAAPARLACVAVVILWPDMLFTATFMAETLHWPLFFWFAWSWLETSLHDASHPRRHAFAVVGTAILGFVGYLAKESFSAVVFAVLVLPAAESCLTRLPLGRNHRAPSPEARRSIRRRLLSAIVFAATFALLAVAVETFLLRGAKGYAQARASNFTSWTDLWRTLRALAYYLGGFGFALGFVPLVAPFAAWKRLNEPARRLFVFSLIGLAATTVGIAVSIVPLECFAPAPRLHLRYAGPLLATIFLVFAASLSAMTDGACRKTALALLPFAILCILLQRHWVVGSGVDNFVYNVRDWMDRRLVPLGAWAPLLPAAAVATALVTGRRKIAAVLFSVPFLAMLAYIQFAGGSFVKKLFAESPESIAAARSMNDWFARNDPDAQVLFAGDSYSPRACLFDTYFDRPRTLVAFSDKDFATAKNADSVAECLWHSGKWAKAPVRLDGIDYVVLKGDHLRYGIATRGVERIPEASNHLFEVCRNRDRRKSPFAPAFVFQGQPLKADFSETPDFLSQIVVAPSVAPGCGPADGDGKIAVKIPSGIPINQTVPVRITMKLKPSESSKTVTIIDARRNEIWRGVPAVDQSIEFETTASGGWIRFVVSTEPPGASIASLEIEPGQPREPHAPVRHDNPDGPPPNL